MASAPEKTIKQLLADLGISVLPSSHTPYRELVRNGVSLGHFTANGAVSAFLAEQVSA